MPKVTAAAAETAHYTERNLEVPDADWLGGANFAGANAPGVGINVGGGELSGDPQQFTLLDQAGNARVPQDSGHIGRVARPIETGEPSTTQNGAVNVSGTANLQTLAAGWVETAV